MVRTLQTTRVNNSIPPPQQAPFYLVVVEEVPMELHHISVRNSVILEDNSEEILATPTPLSESLTFDVGDFIFSATGTCISNPYSWT
jgi:hypothetical protein